MARNNPETICSEYAEAVKAYLRYSDNGYLDVTLMGHDDDCEYCQYENAPTVAAWAAIVRASDADPLVAVAS
jgi:hypothetical protein